MGHSVESHVFFRSLRNDAASTAVVIFHEHHSHKPEHNVEISRSWSQAEDIFAHAYCATLLRYVHNASVLARVCAATPVKVLEGLKSPPHPSQSNTIRRSRGSTLLDEREGT